MTKKLLLIFFIISVLVFGCSSNGNIAGKAAATEQDIYEEAPAIEQQTGNQTTEETIEENQTEKQDIQIKTGEEYYNELINDNKPKENTEEFKFNPESIVSSQNNISLSIDSIKHEIKSAYWGKIVEITATVLNKGHNTFKPKLFVLLYDEKDFREEWLKPKTEIMLEEELSAGEHITTQAIVNIAFDDINLTKNFKLVLVDSTDPANKPLVVVEKNFNALS